MMIFKSSNYSTLFVILLILMNSHLKGQKVELVADTIYNSKDFYNKKYSSFILNDSSAVIIKKDGIKEIRFKSQKKLRLKPTANFFFEVNNKIKIFKEENFDLLPDDLSQVKFYPIEDRVLINDSLILNLSYPSTFLENIDQTNRKIVFDKHCVLSSRNDDFAVLRHRIDSIYILVFKSGEFFKMNHERPNVCRGYGNLIASFNYKNEIIVYDLDFNRLNEYNKYTSVIHSKDYIIFEEEGKPAIVLYKNIFVPIPEGVVKVEPFAFFNLCVVKNKAGLSGLMDSKGNIVIDMLYDEIGTLWRSELIKFRKGNLFIIQNLNGQEILRGNYDDIRLLDNDSKLFEVKKGYKWAVIGLKNEIILPFDSKLYHTGFRIHKMNGEKYIVKIKQLKKNELYNLNGDFIASWEFDHYSPAFRLDYSNFLFINKQDIKDMPLDKRKLLNKNDLWISVKVEKNKKYYRFENFLFKPYSEWFLDIIPTALEGVYVVWTKSKKYGLIKISS